MSQVHYGLWLRTVCLSSQVVVTLLQPCHDFLGIAVVMTARSELCSYEAIISLASEANDATLW